AVAGADAHVRLLADGVLEELDAAVGKQEVASPGVIAGGHRRPILLGPAAGGAVRPAAHHVRAVRGLDRVEYRAVEPADGPVPAGPHRVITRDRLLVAVGVASRLHLLEHREFGRDLGVAGDGIARRGDRPATLSTADSIGYAPAELLSVAAG